jgi:Tfp pilus assembly protein PilF
VSAFKSLTAGIFVLLTACASTPKKPDDSLQNLSGSAPSGPTAEVPDTDAAPVAVAPSGAQSQAATPAPPPRATFDATSQAEFKRGAEALAAGNVNEAEKAFENVLSRNSKADHAYTNLGLIEERRSNWAAAEKNYKRALSVNAGQDAAWDLLARLLCRQSRCAEVERLTRNAIAQDPSALGPRNALVYAMTQQKNEDAAAVEVKKVLKADERNVRAMQLLAQIYFRQAKFELARLVLENARAIDVNDAATHNALGLVQLKLKQRGPALESFKAAAQLQPDFAEARNNYGAMLNEAQDFEASVKELEAAVAAAPDFTRAHLNLGNAYRGRQDVQRALAEYELVRKAHPEDADVYFNFGVVYLDQEVAGIETTDRFKKSIAYFQSYKDKGGKDERVEQYVKDANKGIEKEERKRERDKKDALRKVQAAQDEVKKKAEDEAKAKADAEKKAAADAAKADADKKKQAEADAKAKAVADKQAAADAKKQAALDAKKKAAEAAAAKKKPATKTGAKLGEDDSPTTPPRSGKLSEEEK